MARALRKNASLKKLARHAAKRSRIADKKFIEIVLELDRLRATLGEAQRWQSKVALETRLYHVTNSLYELKEIASHLARLAKIPDESTMELYKAERAKEKANATV